jgi:Uncharacterized protein related to capsule biosynthesis enzymes
MSEQIDFTNCKVVLGRAYNGANGKKIAVDYNGTQYMLKFPASGENKQTELSYTNSCISEHIASSMFNKLGVEAQETKLGTFMLGGKTKIVCACRDFTADGSRLFDFCSIKNTILDSESNGNGTELDDILDTIEKQQYVSPDVLNERFWDMFVIDALLGNFDRHNGNWGFLFNDVSGKAAIAPVYDCGSCLLPQADEGVMRQVLSDEDALNARVFSFPTSAIRENGRKINYYDFLIAGKYSACREAVKRIVPRVEPNSIIDFIDGTPYITDIQKEFLASYIMARLDKILRPAYELAIVD